MAGVLGARTTAALDQLVADLKAAGLSASTDPGRLSPPAVWVAFRSAQLTRLDGGGEATASVYLLAKDNERHQAALGELLDAVVPDVVLPADDEPITATSVELPDRSTVPALRLVVDLDV